MADLFDIDKARERKSHELKEARVRNIRLAFQAVRESWRTEGGSAAALKGLFKKKKKNGRKK